MNSPQSLPQSKDRSAWLICFFAALLGYAAFLFVPQVFNDGDTYLHLAIGEWIVKHHGVPYTDPFSYTRAGAPFIAHEWLSEILMVWAYRMQGWDGVAILFGLATALTFGMLAWHL